MQRSLLSRLWYRFLQILVVIATAVLFRIRYSGRQNIPKTGGVLAVCNHQSHLDPPLIGAGSLRRMNYLARETLFDVPVLRWLIKTLDAIPIDREGIGLSGIKESLRRLKNGEIVLIFPEGTRTYNGEISPFRPGFTALALRSGAAILPIAIDGAYQAWPRNKRFPGLARIRVHYGEPLLPDEISKMDERQLLEEVERRVRKCFAYLQNEKRRTE